MTWPYHTVPDGSAALPHHYYIGLVLAGFVALIVWDNYPRREPVIVVAGALAGLFAFGMIWPRYPQIGATLALLSTGAVLAAPLRPMWWEFWPRLHQTLIIAFGLLALDDVVQHAMGWRTPIDHAWRHGGRDAVTTAFEVATRTLL